MQHEENLEDQRERKSCQSRAMGGNSAKKLNIAKSDGVEEHH